METFLNAETGIEAVVSEVNEKRGKYKLSVRDIDADRFYMHLWHNDRAVLTARAEAAVR